MILIRLYVNIYQNVTGNDNSTDSSTHPTRNNTKYLERPCQKGTKFCILALLYEKNVFYKGWGYVQS